ncbi:N-ethylmaleimide reductase [Pantoea sp. RIT-PI-b]|nr:N-ethylmaleimide reductase [Pantoea sp. RIT-PI-b]
MILANPDFVSRIKTESPLNNADPAIYYGGGVAGYTDYPEIE